MRTSSGALAACARIAGDQLGIITATQAVASGVPAAAIRRLVRGGDWIRVRPSVYAMWMSPSAERWRQRVMAGSLWLADAGAVSHRAAAIVFGLDGLRGAPVELTTTGRQRSRETGWVLHHVATLVHLDVTTRDGMRVTSVARTLVDLCSVVTPRIVDQAMESALRLRLVTLEQIRLALGRVGTARRRAWVLEGLLDTHPGRPTDSALETIVCELLRDGGLPRPHRQYPVSDGSRVVARIDLAYPESRLAIEVDGHAFHSSRRDWQRDRSRQNELTRHGWRIYRLTWEDVTHRPRDVVADVATLLAAGQTPASRPETFRHRTFRVRQRPSRSDTTPPRPA